jgi:thiol-activated cytolysin
MRYLKIIIAVAVATAAVGASLYADTTKKKGKPAEPAKVEEEKSAKDQGRNSGKNESSKNPVKGDPSIAPKLAALGKSKNLDSNVAPSKLSETAVTPAKETGRTYGTNASGVPVTYITTSERFKASAAFDQQVLLNPSTDVIYPGAVLRGDTISSGTYQEVKSGEKADITVSYDLTGVKNSRGGAGKVSGVINPSLTAYRNLHNEIIGQKIGKASTIYSFEATEVYTETDFSLKFNLGVGFNTGIVETSIKSGFDFKKGTKKRKYMVKFMETFYTVDVDLGRNGFLYSKINLGDFNGYRPVYVASLAYGRLAYLTVESDESWDSIKTELSAVVDASLYGKYDAGVETTVNNLTKNSKINITVIGGSSVAVTVKGFMEMLKNDSFASGNPGKIIAYKLRFVDDNTVANTVYNDEYTIVKTTEQLGKGIETMFTLYKIKTNANDGNGSTLELYGNVDVTDGTRKNSFWSLPRSARKKYPERGERPENAVVKYTVPNENASFDFSLELFEADGVASDDDRFTNAMGTVQGNMAKKIMLSNIQDGKDIVIRTNAIKKGKAKKILESDWVEFYIRVNKKPLY